MERTLLLPPLPPPSFFLCGLWGQSLELEAGGPCSRSVCPWASFSHLSVMRDWEGMLSLVAWIRVSPPARLSDHSILPLRVPKEMWVLLESKASLDHR